MRRFLLGLVTICAWMIVPPLDARAQVPDKYKPAVSKGLKWLDRAQAKNGTWAGDGECYRVALTSMAGLAFLQEGSTRSEGKFAKFLRRTLKWLLRQSCGNPANFGLIGEPEDRRASARKMT